MLRMLKKTFGHASENTSKIARSRLQICLSNDRDIIAAEIASRRKAEILAVISKYANADKT